MNNTAVTPGGAPRKADKLATASINDAYLMRARTEVDFVVLCLVSFQLHTETKDERLYYGYTFVLFFVIKKLSDSNKMLIEKDLTKN